jgi:hypothetical protein
MNSHAKIVVALGKMRYRVLVYLFINVLIFCILAFTSGEANQFVSLVLSFINPAGLLLVFLFYGPPSIGYSYPTMSRGLYVFGFFVEMFIVGEIIVSLRKGSKAARTSTKA